MLKIHQYNIGRLVSPLFSPPKSRQEFRSRNAKTWSGLFNHVTQSNFSFGFNDGRIRFYNSVSPINISFHVPFSIGIRLET